MSIRNDADHRKLGRELRLFASDDMIGAGLPLWLPAGAAVRSEIERFVLDVERRAGYQHVFTPPLGKRELYERSGHLAHFAEGMFPPMQLGGEQLVLRPMNCPHHIRVYAQSERSYRDLPIRIAELGAMFRNELSGALGGLSRVRGMTLNDGHVFCRPDQVEDEVRDALALIAHVNDVLGVEVHRHRLSLRGDHAKFAGDDDAWGRSEVALRAAIASSGIAVEAEEGEAAFYGPKLDVQVLDAGGREETLATVQVDMHLPRQFGISFVGDDGRDHAPVLVHRSLSSTLERMVAYLIERYQGAFPTWLSPAQLAVLPVSDEWDAPARDVMRRAIDTGLRAVLFDARHTVNARVRSAASDKIPYIAVVGEREAAAGAVALRRRGSAKAEVIGADDAIAAIAAEAAERRR